MAYRLSNARILEWLGGELDGCATNLDSSKVQVNSAAVWWFCHKLTPDERANILGEFVKHNALRDRSGTNGTAKKPGRRAKKHNSNA